jgi:hypothetical protein
MYSGSLPMDHVSTTVGGANPDGLRTGFLQFWLFVPNEQAAPDTLSAWFNGKFRHLSSGIVRTRLVRTVSQKISFATSDVFTQAGLAVRPSRLVSCSNIHPSRSHYMKLGGVVNHRPNH